MKEVFIVGGGDLAKKVIRLLQKIGSYKIIGYIDVEDNNSLNWNFVVISKASDTNKIISSEKHFCKKINRECLYFKKNNYQIKKYSRVPDYRKFFDAVKKKKTTWSDFCYKKLF